MMRLAMRITGKTLLNVDLESEAIELRDALLTVLAATHFNNLLLVSKKLEKLPLPASYRFRRASKRLDEFFKQMIAERHSGPVDQPDLLSVLVRKSKESRKKMTDEKVRDQILTFFVAGLETIATATMWTWYLLAKHPAVTRKVDAELELTLGAQTASVGDLEKLSYAKMVFAESMRLYPPVWIMGRRALSDLHVNGWMIPKGSYIHVSQFLMHRDARFFPEPERFDPERWTPEATAARPKFCYFPFGGGSMQCIGEGFAWTQGMLTIAILAKRWRLKVVPGHRVELEPQLTLGSRYGMPMILKRRK
jgi:cytochrome P450